MVHTSIGDHFYSQHWIMQIFSRAKINNMNKLDKVDTKNVDPLTDANRSFIQNAWNEFRTLGRKSNSSPFFIFVFHEHCTCTCNLQPQFVGETHTEYVWQTYIINVCLKIKKICFGETLMKFSKIYEWYIFLQTMLEWGGNLFVQAIGNNRFINN